MIKKGTQVEILCGKDKGKKGEVIEILRNKNRAKVKGINIIKKHEKTTKEKKGGIISTCLPFFNMIIKPPALVKLFLFVLLFSIL